MILKIYYKKNILNLFLFIFGLILDIGLAILILLKTQEFVYFIIMLFPTYYFIHQIIIYLKNKEFDYDIIPCEKYEVLKE